MAPKHKIKNVAIIFKMDKPGGVQSCVLSLIKGLNEKRDIIPDILWDIEPDWSLLKEKDVHAKFRKIKFQIPSRLKLKMPDSFRYFFGIFNLIDGKDFLRDYDFFYSFYNGFLIPKEIPHLYYLSGPPLLPQLQTNPPGLKGISIRIFRWLYKNFLFRISPVYEFHRECKYFINSKYTATLFKQAHAAELPVVYPPIDISGKYFDFNDLSKRDSILFFSRIVDYKRPEFVLELARLYPVLRCVIMGSVPPERSDYFEKIQMNAKQMGFKKVTFISNPSNQRINEELGRAKFYVFPAINEHFGMTTPEAIASGVIPFVHNSGGQKDIVNNPLLRFEDSDFIKKFNVLINLSENELNMIRKKLNKQIQGYSEENFINRLLACLDGKY